MSGVDVRGFGNKLFKYNLPSIFQVPDAYPSIPTRAEL